MYNGFLAEGGKRATVTPFDSSNKLYLYGMRVENKVKYTTYSYVEWKTTSILLDIICQSVVSGVNCEATTDPP